MVLHNAANICCSVRQENSAVLDFERLTAIDLNTIWRPGGPGSRGQTLYIVVSLKTEALVALKSGTTANT